MLAILTRRDILFFSVAYVSLLVSGIHLSTLQTLGCREWRRVGEFFSRRESAYEGGFVVRYSTWRSLRV